MNYKWMIFLVSYTLRRDRAVGWNCIIFNLVLQNQ
jgi:hypothetical protein